MGWEQGSCVVEVEVRLPQFGLIGPYSVCRYSPDSLALMTDAKAYEEARTGSFSFDSSDPRDSALSEAMTRERQDLSWGFE